MKIAEDYEVFTKGSDGGELELRENVPIAELTTMRLGGDARFVVEANSASDIAMVMELSDKHKLPLWIMGGGANTIGQDAGYDGIILLNKIRGVEVLEETDDTIVLRGGAGENWDDFVGFACEKGYSGIEAMSAIPGTVGAAPVQNIGAYGQDIASVLKAVYAFDTISRQFVLLENFNELNMGYRQTYFNHGAGQKYIIVAIVVELKRMTLKPPFYTSLQKYIEENHETDFSPQNIRRMVSEIRANKLPDPKVEASAGSFFKNILVPGEKIAELEERGIPVWHNNDGTGKINAGWLIEHCDLKGCELFGFKVSDKASLVLINKSATSYADLAKARQTIVDAVKQKFGLQLEQEPVEIPDDPKYDTRLGITVNYQTKGE